MRLRSGKCIGTDTPQSSAPQMTTGQSRVQTQSSPRNTPNGTSSQPAAQPAQVAINPVTPSAAASIVRPRRAATTQATATRAQTQTTTAAVLATINPLLGRTRRIMNVGGNNRAGLSGPRPARRVLLGEGSSPTPTPARRRVTGSRVTKGKRKGSKK